MSNSEILKDYLRKCRAYGLKKITIATAENTLIPFIEWCGDRELKEFTPDDIYDYLDFINVYTYMKAGKAVQYSPGTKQKI
jgi:hypothetical protein